jgi:hypothetical protein
MHRARLERHARRSESEAQVSAGISLDSRALAVELVSVQSGIALFLASIAALHANPAIQSSASSKSEARAAQSPSTAPLELPDSRAAKAFAASPFNADALTTLCGNGPSAETMLASAMPDWDQPKTWQLWAQSIRLLHSTPKLFETRALLARFALAQQRWDDAWAHFAALDGSRHCMEVVLPSFIPGATSGYEPGNGPLPAPLADGVVLHPSLPPPSEHAIPGRVDVRAMKVNDFVVGKAKLAMRVSVEIEGVQIDIEHRSGEAAHVSIVIPEPTEWAIGNEYIDWVAQTTHHEPLALELKPGEEAHTLYGRFQPRTLSHPTHPAARVPAQLAGGKLWLYVPSEGARRPLFDAIATSLRELPLHLDCSVTTSAIETSRADDPRSSSGITIDLRSDEDRAEKLAWLVSLLEHLCLAGTTAPR